jgi:hypothetical protein
MNLPENPEEIVNPVITPLDDKPKKRRYNMTNRVAITDSRSKASQARVKKEQEARKKAEEYERFIQMQEQVKKKELELESKLAELQVIQEKKNDSIAKQNEIQTASKRIRKKNIFRPDDY